MFDRQSTIIREPSALSFDYIPEKVVRRDTQYRKLEELFMPLAMGGSSCSAYLYGGVGSGKTVTAKVFCRDMAQELFRRNGTHVDTIYVNCRIRNSEYATVLEIMQHYDPGFPFRGFAIEELLNSIKKHISDSQQPTVLILDEVDALFTNSSKDLVYQLSRFSSEIRGKASLSLIMISQSSIGNYIDEASMSSFRRANKVEFNRYGEAEMKDIIRYRADIALTPGSCSDEIVSLIAEAAAPYGDFRFALELLEKSAVYSEKNGDAEILPDAVRTSSASVYSEASTAKLGMLEFNAKIILLSIARAIKKEASISITRAEKTYAVVCEEYNVSAKKHTQFYTYVKEIEKIGVIHTEVRREPEGGRVTHIFIDGIPPKELAKKLEYLLDTDRKDEEVSDFE